MWEDQAPYRPFRQEIIASGAILILVVSASFFAVSHLFTPNNQDSEAASNKDASQILALISQQPTTGTVLGTQVSPTMTAPTPTVDPLESQVNFGKGGLYDYDQYKLQIDTPRLTFNLKDAGKRKFVVDFTLTNKNVNGGLTNQVFASIVKDGNIIVPKTALSLSDNLVLKPGESKSFSGSIALIEATGIKEILFEPQGELPKIVHPLKQE